MGFARFRYRFTQNDGRGNPAPTTKKPPSDEGGGPLVVEGEIMSFCDGHPLVIPTERKRVERISRGYIFVILCWTNFRRASTESKGDSSITLSLHSEWRVESRPRASPSRMPITGRQEKTPKPFAFHLFFAKNCQMILIDKHNKMLYNINANKCS